MGLLGSTTGKWVTPVNNTQALGPRTLRSERANKQGQPKATGRNAKTECWVGNHGRLSGFIVPQAKPAKESRPSRGVGKGAVGLRNRC